MATVRIGHASTSNPSSGKFADQVLIGNYYRQSSDPWTLVLRPRTRVIAEKSAEICEAVCNNSNIGYSQGSRNTLRTQALKAAGLADNDTNLPKVTKENINAITTKCYADCSSFMTFCAIVGGAKITYGSNGATVSTLRSRLTENQDYKALDASMYLENSDYLQRGDILIQSGHTVMVLDRGELAPTEGVYEDSYLDITTIKIATNISELNATSAKFSVKLTKLKEGKESALKDSKELNAYNWSYVYKSLENSTAKEISKKLTMKSSSGDFNITGLTPNCAYILKVTAEDKNGDADLYSSNIIFTTPQSYPSKVTSLTATFNNTKTTVESFKLTFTPPSSWGNASLQKCYRTILYVNGRNVASSDSVVSPDKSYSKTKINISSITTKKDLFKYGDTVQIGVLPGLKNSSGTFIYDISTLACSDPIYIKDSAFKIDKVYLNRDGGLKRAIVYKYEKK